MIYGKKYNEIKFNKKQNGLEQALQQCFSNLISHSFSAKKISAKIYLLKVNKQKHVFFYFSNYLLKSTVVRLTVHTQ